MPRPAGSRNKPKVAYYCDECGETGFATKKCPGCGNLKTLELNKDGIPMNEVQNAIGAQPQMPITLGMAPEFMDPNAEIKKLVSDEQSQAIAEMNLDKVKAKAAAAKADRIREEEELALTEKGFRKPKEHEEPHDPMMPQQQQRTIGMDPAMLLNGIGKWSDEARNDLFDRLAGDDEFALNWSRAFNSMPQQQMPTNAQQMINPMMNPWMQPQMTPQEPPESAASMMTAMIGAVAKLKELSGGSEDGSAAMDRMMDRIERMEERQAERDAATQQRMMEMQQSQQNSGITPQDVQTMIHSTIANSSTDQLAASIESINGVVTGLQTLGVVKRLDDGVANNKEDFEKMKWKDEMAFKREDRQREDTKEERAADVEMAKQDNTKGMFSLLLDMSKVAQDSSKEDEPEDEKPLPPAVARAVVS
jgi:hypothetical protein